MFYRSKFITNSSSTSIVVYGIEFNPDQFENLIKLLWRKYPKEFNKEIHEYFNEDEGHLAQEEDAVQMILDEYDRLDKYLPSVVRIEWGINGTYWLDFNVPLTGIVVDDKVVLKYFSAKDAAEVIALAKDAGVEDTALQLDHWEDIR